jgi:hypothetical protein
VPQLPLDISVTSASASTSTSTSSIMAERLLPRFKGCVRRDVLFTTSQTSDTQEMISLSRTAVVCGVFAVCFLAFAAAGTTPEGKAWLAMKEKEDGVVATGSGLLCVKHP